MISLFFISALAFAKPVSNTTFSGPISSIVAPKQQRNNLVIPKETTWKVKSTHTDRSIHIPLSSSNQTAMTVTAKQEKSHNTFTFVARGSIQRAFATFYNNEQINPAAGNKNIFSPKSTRLDFNQEYGWQEQHIKIPVDCSLSHLELTVNSGDSGDTTSIISISDIQALIERPPSAQAIRTAS